MLQWSVDDVSPNARDPRPVVPFAEAGYNQARVAPTVAGLAAQLSARVDAQARGQAVAQGLPTLPEIRAERSRASSPTDGLRALGRQAARAGRPPSRTTEPTTPKGGDRR